MVLYNRGTNSYFHKGIVMTEAGLRDGARRCAGVAVMGLVLGIVAAVIGGAIWAGIVTLTGYEVGYVAWGVGLIVGVAVAAGAKEPGVVNGVTAAGLAVGGLLLGKLLIFQLAMPGLVAKEFNEDPQIHSVVAEMQVAKDPNLDPDFKAWYDNEDPTAYTEEQDAAYYAKLDQLINERSAQMSEAERDAAVKEFAGMTLASLPIEERMNIAFSGWDLLWFGLAVLTAFKIGSGAVANE